MLEIGRWLGINGEAIYGSRMWRKSSEGPTTVAEGQFTDAIDKTFTSEDFRFTVGNGCIYAICMNMKGKDRVCVKSLAKSDNAHKPDFFGIIKTVEVLGYDKNPSWTQDGEGLKIRTVTIENEKPVVFKIIQF